MEAIERIDPTEGKLFIHELNQVSPDFAAYFVEFGFGEIYSRPVLDSKSKELIAVAVLTAVGAPERHLKLHIYGAVGAGCTRHEIIEAIIQSIIYNGFMRSITALKMVREVFDEIEKHPDQARTHAKPRPPAASKA
jgi:4-carboxymuconolactone decarboxylase